MTATILLLAFYALAFSFVLFRRRVRDRYRCPREVAPGSRCLMRRGHDGDCW